ncbi:MAG: hypothetical protein U1F60_04690 [Planctomycetota bacterium]
MPTGLRHPLALPLPSLLLLLPLHSAATAQAPTSPGSIQWQRSLADVDALVAATGRPVLLALGMDGESASDRIWHENYRDPAFVALTTRCICVGASVFRHNAVDHDQDGVRVPCPRFPGITCGEHIALEPELFARWFPDGERVAPRHALVFPDGRVAFDLSLCFDLEDVDRALATATAVLAPWELPPDDDWGTLAARRDAAGRTQLEQRLAECTDLDAWTAAWQAIGEHGDAGSLDAMRVALPKVPTLPLGPVRAAAARLRLLPSFHGLLRERAMRRAGSAFSLDPAPGQRLWFDALLEADDDASRGLVALGIALQPGGPEAGPSLDAQLLVIGRELDPGTVPRPGDAKRELADTETLQQRLGELERALAERPDDPELLARFGIAHLDLGRVQLAAPSPATPLLFEDAETRLGKALALRPERFDWWLDRAHAAYYRQQFGEQRAHATTALALAGSSWPPASTRWSELLASPRAVEAVRWLGDAAARQLGTGTLADPLASIAGLRDAVLGLGLPAVSPFGTAKDWLGFTSLHGAYGLFEHEAVLAAHAVLRRPTDGELRQNLYTALWRVGRWQDAAVVAERALGPTPSADALWWCGHAHVLVAEELRRRERSHEALAHYTAAQPHFAAAGAQNPAYQASSSSYAALCHLGCSQALLQGPAADRPAAMQELFLASAVACDLPSLRDGLGYDVLDAVDKLLEWRRTGPSPIDSEALAAGLGTAGASAAFWNAAIADSLLREALRADGRNPERRDAETVDAKGAPIRMPMGLPTESGDRYLAAALAAAERAVAAEGATELQRRDLAQILVITAERRLVRGQPDPVRALAQRAALLLDLELAQPPAAQPGDGSAELEGLRRWLAPVRERLGPARPRDRLGR